MTDVEGAHDGGEGGELTEYEHSGIQERHGVIPRWLVAVYAVMGAWMVYYLVAYWTDKG